MYKLLYNEKGREFIKEHFGLREIPPLVKVYSKNQDLEDLQRELVKQHVLTKTLPSFTKQKRVRTKGKYKKSQEEVLAPYFDRLFEGMIFEQLLRHLSIYDENFDGIYEKHEIWFQEGVIESQDIHILSLNDRELYWFDAVIHNTDDLLEPTFIIKFTGGHNTSSKVDNNFITSQIGKNYFIFNVSINPNTFAYAKRRVKANFNNKDDFMYYHGSKEDAALLTDQQLRLIFRNENDFDISLGTKSA